MAKTLKGQTEMMDYLAGNLADRYAARAEPPTERTGWDEADEPYFIVWGRAASFLEDTKPIKVCAAFRYFQEALDYVAYVQDRLGCPVWLQSPEGVKEYDDETPRAVYKAPDASTAAWEGS